MTTFNPHDPQWQRDALYAGQTKIEFPVDTMTENDLENAIEDALERGRFGSDWRGLITAMALPTRACDEVARYVRASKQLQDANYEALIKAATPEEMATLDADTEAREAALHVIFTRRMHRLGMSPTATGHLLTLHLAWERGRYAGIDEATVHIQRNLEEKPNSPVMLRYYLICLGVLPVPSRGKRPKKLAAVAQQPPTPTATPSPIPSSPPPSPANRHTSQPPTPWGSVAPDPLSGQDTPRHLLFDEARALLRQEGLLDDDPHQPPTSRR